MVLDHVAHGARLVVVGGPLLDPHGLGHGDLDVVDVRAVPDALEQGVGEAQGQQVLDRFLAEIMVDTIDLGLVEYLADLVVDPDRRGEIAPDRLLQDHPRLGCHDAGGTGALADRAEQVGRGGEVEQPGRSSPPASACGQRGPVLALGDVQRHVGDPLREAREHLRVETGCPRAAGRPPRPGSDSLRCESWVRATPMIRLPSGICRSMLAPVEARASACGS